MIKYINNNYKFISVLIFIIMMFSIRFPYYIDAPGGISDISDRIEIDGYESKGTFNITYVKEYRATIPTLLIALINKEWDILKEEEVLLDTETVDDYITRDKLFMDESISNAVYVAYNEANKEIDILNSESVVIYKDKESQTDLEVGDVILEVEGNKIENKEDISKIIEDYEIGEKLNIIVENNNKNYNRFAKVIEVENSKKFGILIVNLNEYKTNPNIKIDIEENESGSSGGLITALSIYNSLVSKDITKGYTIVGTGTIDINGNVGSISGISYKLKSAEKENADLFLVPIGNNYEEAIKIKKEKNYKIKIVGVRTFEEALEYLEKM